jgi:hypothetical protein
LWGRLKLLRSALAAFLTRSTRKMALSPRK